MARPKRTLPGRRNITSETAQLLRRLMMIEARTVLSTQTVATIFRTNIETVRLETNKGYPADLDSDLARDVVEGTRVALRTWIERQASGTGALPELSIMDS